MKKTVIFGILLSCSFMGAQEAVDINYPTFHCSDEEVFALIEGGREVEIQRVENRRFNFDEYKSSLPYVMNYSSGARNELDGSDSETSCVADIIPSLREFAMEKKNAIVSGYESAIALVSGGGLSLSFDPIEAMRKMGRKACEAAADFTGTFLDESIRETKNIARQEAYFRLRGTALSGLYGDYYTERYINRIIKDNFGDAGDLLRWRGGYDGSIQPRERRGERMARDRLRKVLEGI